MQPITTDDITKIVPQWYANFVNTLEHNDMYELMLAAHYMDIADLVDLLCLKLATMVRNKGPDEINEIFQVGRPFTPEEEEEIIMQTLWSTE